MPWKKMTVANLPSWHWQRCPRASELMLQKLLKSIFRAPLVEKKKQANRFKCYFPFLYFPNQKKNSLERVSPIGPIRSVVHCLAQGDQRFLGIIHQYAQNEHTNTSSHLPSPGQVDMSWSDGGPVSTLMYLYTKANSQCLPGILLWVQE